MTLSKKIREEFFNRFTRWIRSGSVSWRSFKFTGDPKHIKEVADFIEESIEQAVQETFDKCKKIYVENVDWSEWSKSDLEAEFEFEEEFNKLKNKENK